MTETLIDLFSNFYGDVSALDPNVLATLTVCLGIFVFDWVFRVVLLTLRSMLGLRS